MNPTDPRLTRTAYGLAAALGVCALINLTTTMPAGYLALSVIVAVIVAIPGLLLAFLVWQVTTAERVSLAELGILAVVTLGQALAGISSTARSLAGEAHPAAFFYGVIGLAVATGLGFYTVHAARARNATLRGTATHP